VSADIPVKNIAYKITSADGAWSTTGNVGNVNTANGTVTVNNVPINATRQNFTLTVSVAGTTAQGYPAAISAAKTVLI
jgi:hypothetical protein